jgi:hypothetical protein
MKNRNEYKLIEGNFSPENAKEILISIINNKIKYHELIAFSNHIRFNDSLNSSQKRVEELTKTKESIEDLLQLAIKEGKNLKIDGTFFIEFID